MRNTFFSSILTITVTILCLFTLELISREIVEVPRGPSLFSERNGILVPRLNSYGTFYKPNSFHYTATIGPQGFRGESEVLSTNSRPDELRIFLLGDSFAFGVGVEDEQIFGKLIERRLSTSKAITRKFPSKKIRVLSGGVPNTGMGEQLVWWWKELSEIDHDVLLLSVFVNDMTDDLAKPKFERDAESDSVDGWAPKSSLNLIKSRQNYLNIKRFVNALPLYDWLAEHSNLLNLVRTKVAITVAELEKEKIDSIVKSKGKMAREVANVEGFSKNWKPMARGQLKWLKNKLSSKGIQLVVMLIPPIDYYKAETDSFDSVYGKRSTLLIANSLHDLSNELRFTFLDLRQILDISAENVDEFYIPNDYHLSVKGHELVGSAVSRALASELKNRKAKNP